MFCGIRNANAEKLAAVWRRLEQLVFCEVVRNKAVGKKGKMQGYRLDEI